MRESCTSRGRQQVCGARSGSRRIGGPSRYPETSEGYRFNPVTGMWSALPTAGAPSARFGHSAVWTPSELMLWGGTVASLFSAGTDYTETNDGVRLLR